MDTARQRTPSLRDLQRWMAGRILDPRRVHRSTPAHVDPFARLEAPPCGEIGERVAVYAGGYPARVHEAIEETFPAVAHIVGNSRFADLVHRYVQVVPLRSYNLNDAGADFPRFLCGDPLTGRLPFLPDVAFLEWCVARAFHAAQEPPFDVSALAGWSLEDWEGAVLRFQPSVALVRSEWPIRAIWEARETPVESIDIDVSQRPDRVLVRRSGFAVTCESLGDTDADLLGMLLEGKPLGTAMACLAECGADPAAVGACVGRSAAQGMISDCFVPDGAAGTGTPNETTSAPLAGADVFAAGGAPAATRHAGAP